MTMYSAVVVDKDGGEVRFFKNLEYARKADFIHDLRKNGYRVNYKKVKESKLFDYIMEHTNCDPWDWDLKEVPEDC